MHRPAHRRLNFAIIGCGLMGGRWADFIAERQDAKLTLAVDPDSARAESLAEKYGAQIATHADKAFRAAAVDAVIVATPHAFLFENAKIALEHNCHTLVEKPGSTTKMQMEELANIAEKKHTKLMVGFNYRFIDGVMDAKALADRGDLGELLFIRAVHGHGGREGYEHEWRMNKKISGGGELMDQGVHLIDLVRWFLGGSSFDVRCFASNKFFKADVEDNGFVLLKNDKGQLASVHASLTQWNPTFVFEIYGSKGCCRIEGLGKKYDKGEKLMIELKLTDGTRSVSERSYDAPPFESSRRELDAFVSSIHSGLDSGASGRDGAVVLGIIESAYEDEKK